MPPSRSIPAPVRPRKPRSPTGVHARLSKPKQVTYTGCWTCRSRKVKCDERHRNGCGVCERVGLVCAGYGVNLCWNPGKREEVSGIQRRLIQLDRSSTLALPDREVDRILSSLDMISPSNTIVMGPFAVFQGQICASGDHGPSIKLTDVDLGDAQLLSSSESLPCTRSTKSQSCALTTPLEISMPLFQDSETSLLMFHYKDHVAALLQPVSHPKNPWRTIYFPFAIEGRPDLFLAQSSASVSKASTAIFHGLLSSAAFHLRNINNGLERFHKLGLRHRAKSLQALNAALMEPNSSQMYTVLLTAMLSLVTIDTMTGEDADFPIHLRGCQQLRRCHEAQRLTSSSRQVNSICHFLSLLARTTSDQGLARSPNATKWLSETPLFSDEDRDIEYIYGITPALGNLLHRTCEVAEMMKQFGGNKVPRRLRQARDALKADLFGWSLESEQFKRIGQDKHMLEIIHCQARAFHSAVLILFYWAVEMHHCIDPGKEAHMIWTNLTIAEEKKAGSQQEASTAPMSWPAFIAACEARDRRPWVEWWGKVQDYSLGNFRRQWKVIQKIWEIVDASDASICWHHALRLSGKLILPI